MFAVTLHEKPHFGLIKRAFDGLSAEARVALEAWERGNWVGGKLERHLSANDDVAQEIEAAFAPIRSTLPPRVELWRGIEVGRMSKPEGRLVESWTDDERVAEHYAGRRGWRGKRPSKWSLVEPMDVDVDALVAQYERTGYLKFGGHSYIRSKDDPAYYNIYDRDREWVTDGDDLHRSLTRDVADHNRAVQERLAKSRVLHEFIPRERIVWFTNRHHSKEYLVRVAS